MKSQQIRETAVLRPQRETLKWNHEVGSRTDKILQRAISNFCPVRLPALQSQRPCSLLRCSGNFSIVCVFPQRMDVPIKIGCVSLL